MTSGKSGKWLELQILEQRHHVAPKCHPKNSIQIQTKHVVQPCLHTLRVQMCGPSRIDSCEHRNWQPGEPMRTIWQNLNFGSVTNWENDSCSITHLPNLHFEGLHEDSGMPSARSSEWAAAWPIAHVFGTCLHWTSGFFMFFRDKSLAPGNLLVPRRSERNRCSRHRSSWRRAMPWDKRRHQQKWCLPRSAKRYRKVMKSLRNGWFLLFLLLPTDFMNPFRVWWVSEVPAWHIGHEARVSRRVVASRVQVDANSISVPQLSELCLKNKTFSQFSLERMVAHMRRITTAEDCLTWTWRHEHVVKFCSTFTNDPIWSNMIQYDPIWSNMIQYDPIWSNMIQYDPIWSNMIQWLNMSNICQSSVKTCLSNTFSATWGGHPNCRALASIEAEPATRADGHGLWCPT